MEEVKFGETVIKGKLGFGCMRLKMSGKKIDMVEFQKMVDYFLENGFNYFDTAHGYIDGLSEPALKECLTSKYPRDKYVLTSKLSDFLFKKEEEIIPLFEEQLKTCGVDYFDFYLLHAQNKEIYKKYTDLHAYEKVLQFKKEGKIKHIGISFHDKAEVLEKILTERPEIEVVQIQFNYLDYRDFSVDSKRVYEVCRKFNKPVIIMEPVKGGRLTTLPTDAQKIFDGLKGGSNASYAIRFAAGFEGVFMVLSGMGSMEMMQDNVSYMKNFKPLSEKEREGVEAVCDVIKKQDIIPCTGCRYCTDVCSKKIPIPELFACMNYKDKLKEWNNGWYYEIHKDGGKAKDCLKCGRCEGACPQHLKIRELLETVSKKIK